MTISFTQPALSVTSAGHHSFAAAGNVAAAGQATQALMQALNAVKDYDKVLLRAAAGAGKSYALVTMVKEALANPNCLRVAVTAFKNRQIYPLARRLGEELGKEKVCLFVSAKRVDEVPDNVLSDVTVATSTSGIPEGVSLVIGTSHKLGVFGEPKRLLDRLGAGANGDVPFDVLFVDEAWEMALHLFNKVEKLAPIAVGVGDVGQLPPIDHTQNPWRGDPGYNPYRAWPTEFENRSTTFAIDLPAVWRPTGEQLGLWRSFYDSWDQLDCVAAPGDRSMELPPMSGASADVWGSVASGYPTLLEVDGLEDPEAADIDQPLLGVLEDLLRSLLTDGFTFTERKYDDTGAPGPVITHSSDDATGKPLVVILATRNQAVDDAAEMADQITADLELPPGLVHASTVDKWQGQTNTITVAIHPLSGAAGLDEFNSAFGRLAVTCTRATHGLLMIARAGLDDLLADSPARPGTPFGEPGTRALPRQTHQRILGAFRRGVWKVSTDD
ncbi:hypothetical protein ncot_11880 [Nocardioides sp. JQ2195]|uniref:AAA family ATPase n=1 Tax=Nocardioides sp. JQ2195 TaxID=2592334 RepID=UPI00143E9DEA|nr:hypothetical protein [Nocardioides sp. JQ2195]QIX27220.1 hypothetical protein ncot_11880 [Nocardioides sp. JQ2195]